MLHYTVPKSSKLDKDMATARYGPLKFSDYIVCSLPQRTQNNRACLRLITVPV